MMQTKSSLPKWDTCWVGNVYCSAIPPCSKVAGLRSTRNVRKTATVSGGSGRNSSVFYFRLAYDGFTLGLHRSHQIGRGCSFERESIANFPHEALFQRLNEVYTCYGVSPRVPSSTAQPIRAPDSVPYRLALPQRQLPTGAR